MTDASAPHSFQFANAAHQKETAVAGIWAFLATEALFFGPLFLAFGFSRYLNQAGFDAGASQTNLLIGTLNTVLLVSSSLAFSIAWKGAEENNTRIAAWFLPIAWLLGLSFLLAKFGLEWPEDFRKGLFPGPAFSLTGASRSGGELFFTFYFVSTAIHGLHLCVALLLLGWLITSKAYGREEGRTAFFVVGLYWSFVDLLWLVLYPLIYLVGHSG